MDDMDRLLVVMDCVVERFLGVMDCVVDRLLGVMDRVVDRLLWMMDCVVDRFLWMMDRVVDRLLMTTVMNRMMSRLDTEDSSYLVCSQTDCVVGSVGSMMSCMVTLISVTSL